MSNGTMTGRVIAAVGLVLMIVAPSSATIMYDANVIPDVIFGSGNANGGFTVDTAGGVELGLRAKLRFDSSGAPQNVFNSNGDGTYSFDAGVAPTKSFPTAIWCFEWSVNSDVSDLDNEGGVLNGFTYLLGLDSDPSETADFSVSFDPINQASADHSLGDNSTLNCGGIEDEAQYSSLIGQYNVAQNSWQPHWFINPFDPTVDGTYDIFLAAYDGDTLLARTDIQVIVGEGGSSNVPEPASFAIWALLAIVGISVAGRRRR